MKLENRPKLEWHVRITAPKGAQYAVVSVHTVDRDGQELRIFSQEWPTGRPTPDQLADVIAKCVDDLNAAIVTSIGVQGVL